MMPQDGTDLVPQERVGLGVTASDAPGQEAGVYEVSSLVLTAAEEALLQLLVP